jgi:Zn-dependent oligopeptidase
MGEKEVETLLRLKKEVCQGQGLPFDNIFYLWDYRYYDRLFVEKSLKLNDSLVKEYFPVDVVVPEILEIYQKLLGVKFYGFEGSTWHPGKIQWMTLNFLLTSVRCTTIHSVGGKCH